MSYNIAQRVDVQQVQDLSKDWSLWNTKLKVFKIIFYTINHHKLFSVMRVGFKPFQDLSSKIKVIAQSSWEKSDQRVKCPGHFQQKERNMLDIFNCTKDVVLYFFTKTVSVLCGCLFADWSDSSRSLSLI